MTSLPNRAIAFFSVCLFVVQASAFQSDNWTRFRGDNGSGISENSEVTTSWGTDRNIKWKAEMPGPGSSCPIVYGDQVFLTCYTGYGMDKKSPGEVGDLKRHLLCFDCESGKELWRATVDSTSDEDPYKGFIVDHGYASSTPVTDGEQVFVFFGKTGVVAFDMEGNQQWQASLGTESDPAKWGAGASPVLFEDKVIVNAGIEGHALVALNKADGKEAWRIDDPSFTNSWATPILVKVGETTELVYSVPDKLLGIDPNTGEQLWNAVSPIKRTITASVVANDGVVYTLGGRQGRAIALRCGGRGDVTDTHTVWTQSVSSSIGTPVVFGDHMYWLASGNVAMCLKTEDGSEVNKVRLEGAQAGGGRPAGNYASPIVIGDKMLIVTRSGVTHVLNASPELDDATVNTMDEDKSQFNATPAIAGNQMFIRSDKMLYCIAGEE